jgi:hypothetical protein
LFEVDGSAPVPSTTLDRTLRDAGLGYIDWLKLDSQGKDIDLFRSLDDGIRERLLVLDVEPGVTDFYEHENTLAAAHQYILEQGFWLAKIAFQESVRISKRTRLRLAERAAMLVALPGNPTAAEAQYFRTIEHISRARPTPRDCVCLWVLSMLNGHYGFALDAASYMDDRWPDETTGTQLIDAVIDELAAMNPRARSGLESLASAVTPGPLRPLARRVRRMLDVIRR